MVKYLLRPIGQAVKTPPSHGGNRGSIPLSAAHNIILKNTTLVVFFCAIKCNLCYYYIVILWSMLRTSVTIAMRGSSLVYKRNK